MNRKESLTPALCGAALLVGFFLPWLDVGGMISASGWDMFWGKGASWSTKLWLLGFPLAGIALIVTGLGGDARKAAGVAAASGGILIGWMLFRLAWGFFKTTGIGLWMVIAAAIVALIFGLATRGSAAASR
jgi:hypothetical protein